MLRNPRTLAALLTLSVALVFAGGLGGGFIWDDHALIEDDAYLHNPAELPWVITHGFWDTSQGPAKNPTYQSVWRPLVKVAYANQWQAFGAEPMGYHLVNLLAHLGCALLAFVFIRERIQNSDANADANAGGALLAAGLGALLFAVHPARVESVSWISGAPDLFMTFFVLAGAVLFRRRQRPGMLLGSIACFMLAVFCKEPAVLVPFVLAADLVLLDGPSKDRRIGRHPGDAGRLLAVTVAVVGAFSLRFLFVPFMHFGATGEGLGTLFPRVLASIGHFVVHTIAPVPPTAFPGLRRHDGAGHMLWAPEALILGGVLMVAVVALVVLSRRRPRLRPYLADVAWFVVPLLPVINLASLGGVSLISERFLYLPHVGLAALGARALRPHLGAAGPRRRLITLGALALGALSAFISIRHQEHFQSDEALFGYEAEIAPHNLVALGEVARLRELAHRDDHAYQAWCRAHAAAAEEADLDREWRFGLGAVRLRGRLLSYADQEEFRRIAQVYRDLDHDGATTFSAPGLRMDLDLPGELVTVMREDVDLFLLPYARALMHLGALEEADAVLYRALVAAPGYPRALRLSILRHARAGDFEAAFRWQRHLEGMTYDSPAWRPLRATLTRARDLSLRPAGSPEETAFRDSQVQATLGDLRAARLILDRALEDHPGMPQLIVARARVDVADGHLDLARRALEAARRAYPEHGAGWDMALAEIAE